MSITAPVFSSPAAGAGVQSAPAAPSVQNAAGARQQAMSALLVAVASGITLSAVTLAPVAAELGVNAALLALILNTLGAVPAVARTASIPERVALGENLARRVGFAVKNASLGVTPDQLEVRTRAHLRAMRARDSAARAVTQAMHRYRSQTLGWHAILDSRTTSGCRAAHGNNFHVRRPPIVEGAPAYPGWPHGGSCRCRPVKPFKLGRTLR